MALRRILEPVHMTVLVTLALSKLEDLFWLTCDVRQLCCTYCNLCDTSYMTRLLISFQPVSVLVIS